MEMEGFCWPGPMPGCCWWPGGLAFLQDLSRKSMVNVKTVTASLYFLSTSPLLCCPCWHHGGWRSTCDVWLRHLSCCLLLGVILFLLSGKLFRKNCFTWPFFLESCGLEAVSHGGDGVFFLNEEGRKALYLFMQLFSRGSWIGRFLLWVRVDRFLLWTEIYQFLIIWCLLNCCGSSRVRS